MCELGIVDIRSAGIRNVAGDRGPAAEPVRLVRGASQKAAQAARCRNIPPAASSVVANSYSFVLLD